MVRNSEEGAKERISADYDVVIGLEVHCQLSTKTKLFCPCSTAFGAEPNHQTCPVCLGLPGVLPVLNTSAVDLAVRMALAVGAFIRETSVFARKQYFYPDLPKGYQITQYDLPYCEGGGVKLTSGKEVRLTRIHLEEDAGKNVHGTDASYVDINRAGIPLIEIVSKPDLSSPADASDYLKRLRSLVRHLGISDGNLEEGSFRCDANVSLKPRGAEKLGTRCEIKNLNSFRNVERAIIYEIGRQADILASGGDVKQQTMLFEASSGRTSPIRSKEDSHDYRYFPDPDLGPLVISRDRIEHIKATLPELPDAMARRFINDFGLPAQDAELLTSEPDLAKYFIQAREKAGDAVPAKTVANWVLSEVLREVNERGWDLASPGVTAANLGELLTYLGDGTISGKIAKTVFSEMAQTGAKAAKIIKDRGLVQISDEGSILSLVKQVIEKHPEQLAEYCAGKDKLLGFFVGQLMRASEGRMNPGLLNKVLKAELDRRKG